MIQFTAHITSRQNPVVACYRNAARGLDRSVLLLDGPHLIAEAVTAGMTVRHAMITSEAAVRPEIVALAERLRNRHVELAAVNASVIAAASPVRTPSGIVAIANRPAVDESRLYPPGGLVII